MVRAILLTVLVGCATPSVSVRAAGGAGPKALEASWVLTPPELGGTIELASAGDEIYVLSCGRELRVSKLVAGAIAWSRVLDRHCVIGNDHVHPIAATSGGVFVAVATEHGSRLFALGKDGVPAWDHAIDGGLHGLGVAATPARVAVCFETRAETRFDDTPLAASGFYAIELDEHGTRIETHALDAAYAPPACSYDEHDALWAIVRWDSNKPLHVADKLRSLAPGTWALRLTGPPRFLSLGRSATIFAAMPSGFVVDDHHSQTLGFVDLEGVTRWRLERPRHGCEIFPRVIAASPVRLLVDLPILCDVRQATTTFGDVTIHDESHGKEEPLGERAVIVELDMTTQHATAMFEIADLPHGHSFAELPRGLVAFGEFKGTLELARKVHSQPPHYLCNSTMPEDAPSWDSFPVDLPHCPEGHYLVTSYPSWPFVAAFTTR